MFVSDSFSSGAGAPVPAPWVHEANNIWHYSIGFWPSGSDGVGGLANNHNIAHYGGAGWAADQLAAIILTSVGAGIPDWAGPMVRCQTGAASGYAFKGGTISSQIMKMVAGAETTLASGGPAAVDGDAFSLGVTGDLLEGSVNGTVVLSVNDSTFTGGEPGIYAYGIAIGMDNFFAQDLLSRMVGPFSVPLQQRVA